MSSKLKSSTVACDFIEQLDPTRDDIKVKDKIEFQGAVKSDQAPPGFVGAFAKSSPPSGWLKCNGAAISRTTYADLFAEIGTTFGVGDGSTTFNVPDLRGEFVRGWIDDKTLDPETGRAFGSHEDDAMQRTYGRAWARGLASNDRGGDGVFRATTPASPLDECDNTAEGSETTGWYFNSALSVSPTTAKTNDYETRPMNTALLYCIKY